MRSVDTVRDFFGFFQPGRAAGCNKVKQMAGVLIFQGMSVGVLPGDLTVTVDDHGTPQGNLILSTAYNVIPIWLRIADDNLKQARAAAAKLAAEWNEEPNNQKALLIAELAPSMQVCVACGIALDGLYDTLRPLVKLSGGELAAWKRNRTARGARIAAVIQRAYRLDNKHSKEFRTAITDIIRFRDLAVHPSQELKRACTRPDLTVGVDWKFSAYRCSNASTAFEITMKMFIHLYEKKGVPDNVRDVLGHVFQALQELGVVTINAPPV